MGVHALKRVVWAGVMFLGLSTVTFVVFFVLPHVDPGRGRRRFALALAPPAPVDVDQHRSLVDEYGQFLWNLLDGNLGRSAASGHDVLKRPRVAASEDPRGARSGEPLGKGVLEV